MSSIEGFANKYRPQRFAEVIGQPAAVQQLQNYGQRGAVPHAILFTGPSGCGKTTMARILARKLGCKGRDFIEQNSANYRGIDSARDILRTVSLNPMYGKVRVWLLDEVHSQTHNSEECLLKVLEDTPSYVYFLLCTTDPQKLTTTFRRRCTEIALKPLGYNDVRALLSRVLEAESVKVEEEVAHLIAEVADGNARFALVLLDKVVGLESMEAQLEAVGQAGADIEGRKLASLLHNSDTRWPEVAGVLEALDPTLMEGVRRGCLKYATKVLLGGGAKALRAHRIIWEFRSPWYDCGLAGLVQACWDIVHSEKS